jgi:hypothetical protein
MFGYRFTPTVDICVCVCDKCGERFDVRTGGRTDFCPTCLAMFAVNRAMLGHSTSSRAHEPVFATSVSQNAVYIIVDETPKQTYCLRQGCTKKTSARGGCCTLHRCAECEGPKDGRSTICDMCKVHSPVQYSSFW